MFVIINFFHVLNNEFFTFSRCVLQFQRIYLKLLVEVFLITKMNTVIGKYIKGLNIFLSYLT